MGVYTALYGIHRWQFHLSIGIHTKWTSLERPPVVKDHCFLTLWVVFPDRFQSQYLYRFPFFWHIICIRIPGCMQSQQKAWDFNLLVHIKWWYVYQQFLAATWILMTKLALYLNTMIFANAPPTHLHLILLLLFVCECMTSVLDTMLCPSISPFGHPFMCYHVSGLPWLTMNYHGRP